MPRQMNKPFEHPSRNDTLGLCTRVHYDRDARRPSTPILVGDAVVMRRPIPNAVYTEYLIMDGEYVAGRQISVPSIDDCKTAINASQRARGTAKSTADGAIAKAKRGTRSKKSEVPA